MGTAMTSSAGHYGKSRRRLAPPRWKALNQLCRLPKQMNFRSRHQAEHRLDADHIHRNELGADKYADPESRHALGRGGRAKFVQGGEVNTT
jgi:hypothetical protein